MATKHDEIHDSNSVLAHAADDEPLFILCARDRTAIPVIGVWITIAEFAGIPKKKIANAIRLRDMMLSWQSIHPEKLKMPD